MKIVLSRGLLKASETTGISILQNVAHATGERFVLPQADINSVIDESIAAAAEPLKHISVYRTADADEVVFEISDALILRVFDMYSHVSQHLCSIFMFVRPLFGMFTREMKAIDSMVFEKRK